MWLRSSILALAAIVAVVGTSLVPASASAHGYRSGHHIIVVCHKAF
jgi:hypothetical protein